MNYKQTNEYTSQIVCLATAKGESIEEQMRKVVETKEPIDNVAPMIYTERKDGVIAAYDPRTDRWDIACEAMDKVSKSHLAQRQKRIDEANGKPEGEEATE